MSKKKLSAKQVTEIKQKVKDLVETGMSQLQAITAVVEPMGLTYNQAYYRYYNPKTKRGPYKKRKTSQPISSEFSSLRFSLDLIDNVHISDNVLVINFK